MKPLPERTDPQGIRTLLEAYTGRLAFDIGANTGQVARLLAPNFDDVECFEPCVESFSLLSNSVPDNVGFHAIAVSNHDGKVSLSINEHAFEYGELCSPGPAGEMLDWGTKQGDRSVVCMTLDALVDAWGKPDFIKIDTEGHEVEVVEGGYWLWVGRDKPRLLIEVHHRDNQIRIEKLLGDAYDVKKIVHEYHAPNTPMYEDHFYLRCEPREIKK